MFLTSFLLEPFGKSFIPKTLGGVTSTTLRLLLNVMFASRGES